MTGNDHSVYSTDPHRAYQQRHWAADREAGQVIVWLAVGFVVGVVMQDWYANRRP